MPDPVTTETPVATSTQAPPAPEPTQQQASREQVYARLYGEQATPAAQPPAPQEPDYKAMFTQLSQQVNELTQRLAAPPATSTSGAVPTEPAKPEGDWWTLLQEGRRTEAEQALINRTAQGAGDKIIQEVLQRAASINRIEREVENFNNQVKSSNPDLLDVEDLISLKAEKLFYAEQPNIKSEKDYLDVYKRVVNSAVDDIRQRLQRTRAAAKNEAMTTRREILSSTTMNPNDITRREESTGGQQPQQAEMPSTQDYLEMRKLNRASNALTPEVRRAINAQG